MSNKDNRILTIEIIDANAKDTGRPYKYVKMMIEGIEITRIYPKDTEISYFSSLVGSYEKTDF